LRDSGIGLEKDINPLVKECEELANMLGNGVITLKKKTL
jgi:hypothetical protein